MSNNIEIYKLLNGQTKVPKLSSIPHCQLVVFSEENSSDETTTTDASCDCTSPQSCCLESSYEETTSEESLEQESSKSSDTSSECKLPVAQTYCKEKLQEFAERTEIPSLQLSWEKSIRDLIPEKLLRRKHKQTFEKLMDETREHFREAMQYLSVRCIVFVEGYTPLTDPPYKNDGRSENYGKYLENRCFMFDNYFLHHKLIKRIVHRADLVLPATLCDFRKYNPMGFLNLIRFADFVETDIKNGGQVIEKSYFTSIVKILHPRYVNDVPSSTMVNFLNCATKILSLQIMNCKRRSMEHLLEILSSQEIETVPLLKLSLQCEENSLFVLPTIEEICDLFHSFLDFTNDEANAFSPLHLWVGLDAPTEFMSTRLPDWLMEQIHHRLNAILVKLFAPLNSYVMDLHNRYGIVYNPNTHEAVKQFVAQGHNFDECVARLEEFSQFFLEFHGMAGNEFFTIGRLAQDEAKEGLKSYTEKVRALIISELVQKHKTFNMEICEDFERLEEAALNIPSTTKELLELGEYMVYARTKLMEVMHERITESLRMATMLHVLTTLDREHVELNNSTVNWLKLIKAVFETNSSLYEQAKFELEEKLQERIAALIEQIDKFFPRLSVLNEMGDVDRIQEYIETMRKFARELEQMDAKAQEINEEEALFKFPQSTYPKIDELKGLVMPFYHLIYLAYKWQRKVGVWLHGPFENLDAYEIETMTNDFYTDFSKISKTFKTKIKMQIATNYPYTLKGSVDDSDPDKQPAPIKLCHYLTEHNKWFKKYVPLAIIFCNPALRQRHWDEMSEIAGFDLTPDAGTTLHKIINLNLMSDLENYELVSVGATKELGLQELLHAMSLEWDDINFQTSDFKDTGVKILSALDDIMAILEDHIVKVQAMRGSAFVRPIQDEVKAFYDTLLLTQLCIEEWAKVQVQWMYFLPIFSSKDIVAQLQEEAILFFEVDGNFRHAMHTIEWDPLVKNTAASNTLCESMINSNKMLDEVNQGVLNYLERKRLYFPRFFFLSNDDMLEILSETKEPLRVQPHLKKCFEGIYRLGFNEDLEILSMFSDDREEVKFEELVSTDAARGCVERWLVQVEEQMVRAVRHEVLMSYMDYVTNERANWVKIWPGMVVLCVSQIYWSMEVQTCLMTHFVTRLESLYEKLQLQILDMVELVKGQLSKQNRTTLNALITIDVHSMDVVSALIQKRISNETDFEWLAQLRYYWEDDVLVRIINATVNYAYEYLGNCPRLVITPLTDRCYRTLIGAYSLHLNGAPEGPAGTGKTETTKDLARALAVQCVVFNCSDGLDYKNMGKFFKGLASCGAWACFDEFNRIELEVLSVVAQQILCIIQAVRAKLETFVFEGTELRLNPAVYVCITMNPGYAGRSELPDNLKVLFRTVAMMVPDYTMIGEIFLYSSGFATARSLAVKIVTTYKLCSEQLSTQRHYDYGMRAVKTVLTAAQNMKLKYPDENEMILMLRSIIDVNLPKFLAHDVPLFQGIISDLFPGIELPAASYDVLLKAVKIVAARRNLQVVDVFLLKIIQVFEMMIVRHGFMVIGDPFGGKTSVLYTLADALTLMGQWGEEWGVPTKFTTINPKSISMGRLYGQFDPISSEWTDGVCAVAFRQYCTEESADRKWVIFDGPIDAVWIENLNTVLDDNKKLCLTSGEIMQMTNEMSMIFEAMDVLQASPATVSRCGMIYIEPKGLGWRPFVKSWLNDRKFSWRQEYRELFSTTFDWLFEPCLEFVRLECRVLLNVGQIGLIVSTLELIDMYITQGIEDNPQNYDSQMVFWCQSAVLVAIVWGMGGTLDLNSKSSFNEYLMSFFKEPFQTDYPVPQIFTEVLITLPGEGLLHDYFYTFKGKGAWKNFSELAKAEKPVETQSISQMMVPTIDTVKYQSMFLMHIKRRRRFLLYGNTGTGKSFYIQEMMMNKLSEDEYLPNLITFTARTSAAQAQDLVISKLYKRRKGHFAPPSGAHCVVFIDDVNMPAKEEYGAQPAIEVLRQFFDHQHWYDLKSPDKVYVYDTMFVCAMAPPGGSRQEIYKRFLRHFNLYAIMEFSTESVSKIFTQVALVGLRRNGFATDVMPSIVSMVNATLEIFKSASLDLRPTPMKSHYMFNLRDFSRVITGCAMLKRESFESKATFHRLWVHETLRVFGDRLIEAKDRQWLFEKIKNTFTNVFKESFDNVFFDLPKSNNEQLTEESLLNLIFGNFMDPDAIQENRLYEEVKSLEKYKEVAEYFLEEYNTTHKSKIDIVLFRYALEHLARICRILTIPCGSLLMVGVGGSGRQSLTRLAAFMSNFGLFQPEIGSAYGMNEWREDVKKVLKNSGGTGKDFVFLFTEGQIKQEAFLSDIDSLLNAGEVPNLFNIEEKQEIVEMTRLAAQGGNRNLDVSIISVLAFFVNRCKEKLHLMLCFSPIGDSFRIRLRLYPSLVNCCTIDWFEVWPEDALEQVAVRFTTDINVDERVKVNSIVACKYFHVCAKEISANFYKSFGRKTYITSAAFLDLIRTFSELIGKKQAEVSQARDRYLNGLDKLEFAAQQVSQMQITLTALQPQLVRSAKLAEETMKQIERENVIVERTTEVVKIEEDAANIKAEKAGALKAECEADLAEAIPVLEEAIGALNTLKPADITLVKAMKNPPAGVKLVMAAVCIMLDVPADRGTDPRTGRTVLDYWAPSKRILSDMKFLDYLRDYDKDNIAPHIMQTIKKTYMSNKMFEPKMVAKASSAAEGLCKWIRAMVLYYQVLKIVAPKKEKLAAAEKEYSDTMELLNEKRRALAALNQKLANLNRKLQETMATKIRLQKEVTLCKSKLIRAEKLIKGLGGEKDRWTLSATNLQKSYETLPGDTLISCGMIAYLGPFTIAYRLENLEKWRVYVKSLSIPCSDVYNFIGVLGSEIQINSWNIHGLPRDSFSTENAIIMDNSKRWSLFIDPQSQANKWIRNMEKQRELEIVKITDKNYMAVMEQSIEFGKPVLIENIGEELDPALDPILSKNIYRAGGKWYITLGEKSIEYGLKFRLYITTKLRNPHYLPEVFNKVTLINFALTIDGLEDQLLGIVVAKERPDLQEKREYLIVQSAANKKALKQVEDDILKTLDEAGATILEDEEAIEILDSSKILSIDILKKQEAAKETEAMIELFRQSYRSVAKHGSSLYYTVTDLPTIDPMYQYSLAWFINLYVVSIETANKSKILDRRLMFLRDTFTYTLYQNVCRSLFERDKVLYSFVLYTTILSAGKILSHEEINFFVTGGMSLGNEAKNPAAEWLSDKSWDEICRVESLQNFQSFSKSFRDNVRAWKSVYDAMEPQDAALPEPWQSKLSDFDKLIVIRMLRPDKVIIKIKQIVGNEMGAKFITPPPFDISKSYNDSNCLVPLIFILSPGSDPMGALTKFAEYKNYTNRFRSISLGQGQGPIARGLIDEGKNNGSWVCLQNCHLAVSWMPELEKICEGLDPINTSINFRLWLTSYPSDKFPISVLQNGVKITNEPPTGLQQNLMRSYTNEPVKDPDFFTGCVGKHKEFSRLLYALCFFHAVVQERRSFGSQGWNIQYGFNESDFQISVQQLQILINEYDQVPFKAITYLTGECNYGGRVTDDRDRRCLITILQDFCNKRIITDAKYSFCDIGPEYNLPKRNDYSNYINHINQIPLNNPPEVFGLHMNAGITRDLKVSKVFFESCLLIQGTVSVGDASKYDELILSIKADIYDRMPDVFNLEQVQKSYPVVYEESMNTVLLQEMERYNILLTEIKKSLTMLQQAVEGLIVMTPELEIVSMNLMNSKVPPSWSRASAYPSLKPLASFVNDFLERLSFLQKWRDNGKPATFWISGFSFVHAFLTGAMQNFARKYVISIDKLTFDYETLPTFQSNDSPKDGVYVYGMFLAGAQWNIKSMMLEESQPKVLWNRLPLVWIKPIEIEALEVGRRYSCPLYITSERYGTLKTTGHSTNYVLSFLLNTDKPVSHWIKRGLALLCQLDD